MNNEITVKEMIKAIPAGERSHLPVEIILIARGDIKKVSHQNGKFKALHIMADIANAVYNISDPIFMSRNKSWEKPTEQEEWIHDVKLEWLEIISLSITYLNEAIKNPYGPYGEEPGEIECRRELGADFDQLLKMLRENEI